MVFSRQMRFFALASALAASACTQTFDVGHNRPHGLLPVDQRNPIILLNDGAYDNWSGEYAVLLANGGGSPLAAIIVNETSAWPDIQTNVGGYRDLVVAARSSGLENLPDPIASIGAPLVLPASGNIDDKSPLPACGDRDGRRPDRRRGCLSGRSHRHG